MKRKILLLCLLCLLILSGCSRKTQIGLCLAQPDSQFAWLEDALKKAGYQVAAQNAGLDQAVQNRQANELLAEECDLLIVEPVMADEAASLAQFGEAANVPILFTGKAPAEAALDWKKTAYIGLPKETAVAVQGQLAAALPGGDLNGDGVITYAVIAGPETDVDAIALTENCQNTLEGQCLAVSHGEWDRAAGETACGKLLSTWGKDLEVVLCNSDELALGALDAIREGGRTVGADIFLVGLGGGQQAKLLVRSGDFSGTVSPDTGVYQELVLSTVKKLLSGGSVEKQQYGTFIPITAENVEDYLD